MKIFSIEQKCHDLDKKLTESSNLLEEETTKFKKSQLACKELGNL